MISSVNTIIPCYKVENYLSECIDSVLEQTFIDNNSTDNTFGILTGILVVFKNENAKDNPYLAFDADICSKQNTRHEVLMVLSMPLYEQSSDLQIIRLEHNKFTTDQRYCNVYFKLI